MVSTGESKYVAGPPREMWRTALQRPGTDEFDPNRKGRQQSNTCQDHNDATRKRCTGGRKGDQYVQSARILQAEARGRRDVYQKPNFAADFSFSADSDGRYALSGGAKTVTTCFVSAGSGAEMHGDYGSSYREGNCGGGEGHGGTVRGRSESGTLRSRRPTAACTGYRSVCFGGRRELRRRRLRARYRPRGVAFPSGGKLPRPWGDNISISDS